MSFLDGLSSVPAEMYDAFFQSATFTEFWVKYTALPAWIWFGIMTYVFLEFTWFLVNFPYFVLDYYKFPYFDQYKIQTDKEVKKYRQPTTRQAVYHVLVNVHLFTIVPLVVLFNPYLVHPTGGKTPCISYSTDFPTWSTVAWQVIFCFLAEDTVFYWGHRALHTKALYKIVHKQHHIYKAPYSWTSFYAHPLDIIFGNFVPFISGLLFLWGRTHALTFYAWLFARLVATTDVHCGYAFPWSLERWFPFYAGPRHHDTHHELFNYNFSSTNIFWDWICGTGTPTRHAMSYDNEAAKQSAAKAMKSKLK